MAEFSTVEVISLQRRYTPLNTILAIPAALVCVSFSFARRKQIPSIISARSLERRANTPFVVRERRVRAPPQRFV